MAIDPITSGAFFSLRLGHAAAVIDNNNAVLHLGYIVLIDDTLRVREQRAVQCDNVGLSKKRVSIHIFGDLLALWCRAAAGCKDIHSEGFCNAACCLPDLSEADYAHCFSCKLNKWMLPVAPVGAVLPFPGVYTVGMHLNMAAYFKQH